MKETKILYTTVYPRRCAEDASVDMRGWYFGLEQPGAYPSSILIGPFDTEPEAIREARILGLIGR